MSARGRFGPETTPSSRVGLTFSGAGRGRGALAGRDGPPLHNEHAAGRCVQAVAQAR